MATECTPKSFAFHPLGRREVIARFAGGRITSDGGGLLLREVERLTGVSRSLAPVSPTVAPRTSSNMP